MSSCDWPRFFVLTATLLSVALAGTTRGQSTGQPPRVAYGPQQGSAARPPAPASAPAAPFQLDPRQQAAVDQLLKYWERFSGRVVRYRCGFTRWEYDSNFGPRDPNTAKTRSEGEIKYESPDKGLFRVDKIEHFTLTQGGRAEFRAHPGEKGEHWICDGKAIYEFDYLNRRLKKQELPPNMQGTAIADGPLPFLFGAKADKIKRRYWVRTIPPPQGKEGQEYWLQAFPKMRNDAANFKVVEVILDAKLFLPSAIQVYDPGYNGRNNFSRLVYVFEDRKVNERFTPEALKNIFTKEFYKPSPPLGWKEVVERYDDTATAGRAQQPPPRGNEQATRPLYQQPR